MKLMWEDTVEERARAVVECYLEDMASQHPREDTYLTETQREVLLNQVEVAIRAQRTEWQEVV